MGVAELFHETNVLNPELTTYHTFEKTRGIFRGRELIERFQNTRTPLGGVLAFASAYGLEVVPILSASATPSGTVTASAYKRLKGEIVDRILRSLRTAPLDTLCLSLHGSMVVEGEPDAEGNLLSTLKQIAGLGCPISAVLDMHANVSRKMIGHLDAVTVYESYPHIDHYQRGWDSALLAWRTVMEQIRPMLWLEKLPLSVPCVSQLTSRPPMRLIATARERLKEHPRVLGLAVATGFVQSCVPEVGFSIIGTTDNDEDLARKISHQLARKIWALRNDFKVALLSPKDGVARALRCRRTPVVLADVGDNPGGGGTGDDTSILRELFIQKATPSALAAIADPKAVRVLAAAGVGKRTTLPIGAPSKNPPRPPLSVTGVIRVICDGTYINRGPMRRGDVVRMGKTVLIDCDGVQVIVCEKPIQPWDPEVFRLVRVDPVKQKILVVKSAVHFRASFGPIATGGIFLVDTPGLTREA